MPKHSPPNLKNNIVPNVENKHKKRKKYSTSCISSTQHHKNPPKLREQINPRKNQVLEGGGEKI